MLRPDFVSFALVAHIDFAPTGADAFSRTHTAARRSGRPLNRTGILGRFYGPRHEEVGGVFQFSSINGAFGAVRQ